MKVQKTINFYNFIDHTFISLQTIFISLNIKKAFYINLCQTRKTKILTIKYFKSNKM